MQWILINKALTPWDRAPEEKKGLYEFCCSRHKCTCLAALNEQWSSQLSTWVPIKNRLSPQAAPWTRISKESPHTGLIRLTFGGHHSGTKIAEEETGSNPFCSAAAAGDPQASRAWSGPQQSYNREARLLEGKLSNRNNFIINNLDIHSETQSENQQLHRRQVDKSTKMGRKQRKKEETPETRKPLLLQGITTPHQQGNKAGWRMSVMKWQNQTSEGG